MKKFVVLLMMALYTICMVSCSERNETIPENNESVLNEEQTSSQTDEVIAEENKIIFDAKAMWEEFIENETYRDYEKTFTFDTGSELFYAIIDLNDDDKEELLITADEGMGFGYSWLFAFDEDEDVKLVREFYGYGSYKFNELTNVIYGPSTFKPFKDAGEALFYTFDGENLNDEYSIVNDMGVFYYVEGETMEEITDTESYYEDFNEIELTPIK